jgi:hypothetical protein
MPTSSVAAGRGSRVHSALISRRLAGSLPTLSVWVFVCVALLGSSSPATAATALTASSQSIVNAIDAAAPFRVADAMRFNATTPHAQDACTAMVGGVVWHDIDLDGENDGVSEPGINGVEVTAYTDDGDGKFEPGGQDTFYASATTALDSYYHSFEGTFEFAAPSSSCLPDRLWIDIGPTNFAAGGLLEDMVLTSGTTHGQLPMLIVAAEGASARDTMFGYNIPGTYAIITAANPPPAAKGALFTLSLEIENTGQSVITTLPLKASYDTTYLAFNKASLAPDEGSDDGALNWSNLLASQSSVLLTTPAAPTSLAPGASITIDLTFVGVLDTTELPGGATTVTVSSEGAMADPDGPDGPLAPIGPLPLNPTSTNVAVYNPTGVTVALTRAIAGTGLTKLAWETADETGILGFNVLRQDAAGDYVAANAQLIVAKHAGLPLGAAYAYAVRRTTFASGTEYALEVVRLDGRTERHGFAITTPGKPANDR